MLEFHPLQQGVISPERQVELLLECKAILASEGMASIDEYGDMLKWGLPKKDGMTRNMHVFHPDWCSYSDQFKGTIHFHGGVVRGNILLGHYIHSVYEPKLAPDGNRFFGGRAYKLTEHAVDQPTGSCFEMQAMVPHWLRPTELTLTYFEEEDNERMGDLVNPASEQTDEHTWEQEQTDALLPELLQMIDARLAELTIAA